MDTGTVLERPAEAAPNSGTADNPPLVNSIDLSTDDINGFRDKGYIALRNLLTPEGVAVLRDEAKKYIVAARDVGATYGDTFNRLTYALGETAPVKSIYLSNAFRKALVSLTGNPLIMTEGQGFELVKDKTGFPWHYGSISFRWIRPQDLGYTIWIPLDPINVAEQGGGMAYIPETLFSARGNYQMSSLLSTKLNRGEAVDDVSAGLFKVYDENSLLMTDLFEKHKEEDDFALGDAFFFNKNVWHRSSPLREGPLKSRLAVNIRFIDWDARLDMEMYQGEQNTGGGVGMGANFGKLTQTTFGSHFTDIGHGDEVRDSKFCGPII